MPRILFVIVCILLGQRAFGDENKAFSRNDLAVLKDRLCSDDESPSAHELWKLGLFDTQVNAMRSQRPVDTNNLVAQVRTQLQKNKHHGYSYGQCPDGQHAWLITTPAPVAIVETIAGDVTVALPTMQGLCASVDIDFAADDGGMPRKILRRVKPGAQKALINPHFLRPGTLSVTCQPLDPKKDGPQLWALTAIQNGSLPIHSKSFDIKDFYSWLQNRRSEQGLGMLAINQPELQKLAEELSATDSLKHPRALLTERGKDLKKKKINLLGENRAAAGSLSEMAWLLWNSPQHRRLLLNPKANSMGLSVRGTGREKLLVMVVGKI
jgi:hypothetical protein